jgi:disease resistance protein RPM1
MTGTMVSASTGAVNSLLGKLTTLMGEEYGKLKGIRKEVVSLEEEFRSMKALLEKLADMDELDAPAKEWRNQVKDMSYDIEDCIDDFMHHFGKHDATDGFVKKTAKLLKKLRARHQIASKIQEIKVRMKEVNERRMRYRLDYHTSKPTFVPVDPRVVAIYAEAAGLVGIDIPADELTAMLMGEEEELKVASIVGFGGLGKTTLANQVYRKLEGQFECRAFVSVSQKPDIPKLLNKVLLKIGGCVSHTSELDDLLKNITEQLQDKRY